MSASLRRSPTRRGCPRRSTPSRARRRSRRLAPRRPRAMRPRPARRSRRRPNRWRLRRSRVSPALGAARSRWAPSRPTVVDVAVPPVLRCATTAGPSPDHVRLHQPGAAKLAQYQVELDKNQYCCQGGRSPVPLRPTSGLVGGVEFRCSVGGSVGTPTRVARRRRGQCTAPRSGGRCHAARARRSPSGRRPFPESGRRLRCRSRDGPAVDRTLGQVEPRGGSCDSGAPAPR